MFPRCRLAAGLLATTAFLLSSCNSPTRPETARPETPGQPTAGTTTRLQVVAPTEIAPGQSVQLIANATRVNGSVEDVSRRADWKVVWATGSSVLVLTETGVVTGADLGYGTVEVTFEGKSAIAVIIVVPKGTYRLLGTISESGVGLHDVTVTALSGIGEPLTTRTVDGFYAFYGVAGGVQLKATRDGYVDKIEQITVTGHRSHSFEMTPSRPRIDLSGTYTLTVTTEDTPSCPTCSCSALPQEGRRRVYTATLEQTAADLKVSLSGADFVFDRQGGGNTFRGIAAASGEIIFWLLPATIWDYDGPEVVERLSDGTAICVAGTINARSTPTGISGTASRASGGTIYLCSGSYTTHSGCPIDRFEMVRR